MKIRLREILKDRGYSEYEFARRVGVSKQIVNKWINGEKKPSYERLEKICSVLECKVGDILEAEL